MRELTSPVPIIPLPTGHLGKWRRVQKRKGGSKMPFRALLGRKKAARKRERQARRAMYRARRR